ncbi:MULTISPECIES: pyridoxamine 5'-phosphate oxidase family protein [unclassified Cupriavidus]|uniref:pyridoxamine 5'-phosphate oxidase family protein n=1 Tax=unclassified Cupriavidus TaxID=2640874 RepID=UPI0002910DEE|nr:MULTISPECIES: pyridoxamine 5'-phosphate oxidase family protein [unclassified Cupriavidus]ESH95054.1 flavin-nucleotide-binding protein [Cupriavidus sp. HPC(L)]MCD9120420.1 pyridoxamine 5'-phosphate oxidase family protein [Cupriavidus sp. UGS-1]
MTPAYLTNEMRRTDLAWSDWPAIEAFLKDELICRVAVHDNPFPYVTAQSFTFTGDAFLIHSSRYGKLASAIRANPHVTIEIDRPVALLKAPKGQNTSLEYYSVIARCVATLRDQTDEIRAHQYLALDKFRPEKDYTPIEDGAANQIVAYRCEILSLSAKKRILADGQYSPPGQPRAPYLRYPFPAGATLSALPEEAFDPQRFSAR